MKSSLVFLLLMGFSLNAASIEITTETGSERELETVRILEALRIAHDLSRWEFTDSVNVEAGVIPHSHPVLTLNTRHNGEDESDVFLSTYLHEQIHWHEDERQNAVEAAIEELKAMFPEVPVGHREGGRDESSTYLHLIVCYLELEAIARLLSAERIEALNEYWLRDHYTWIYRQVMDRGDEIGEVIRRNGLEIPVK